MRDSRTVERNPWLLASLVAGMGYFLVKDSALPWLLLVGLKGAGVTLLAGFAWSSADNQDGRMLAGVMALGALGDVLIEIALQWGALAFFFGHVLAIALYLRHRRETLTLSQKLAAATLLLATPIIAYALPADRAQAPGIALYALALGGMACAAWASSFPRYRVGIGAVLFVASDLLIFARMGPLAASPLPGLTIWPLYYFGQLLICTGVVSTLKVRATPQ